MYKIENTVDDNVISSSVKWASLAEIVSKLIGPITTMILARLLTPEDFGVIASITMLLSFCDIFTDSGFSKYVIHHHFDDSKEENDVFNVSFWSNFILSVLIYTIIFVFSGSVSRLLFGSSKELLLRIAGLNIIITSFSAIQNALIKKRFKFKIHFYVRVLYTLVPLFITLPLAFTLKSYWAVCIGNLLNALINSAVLLYFSDWRPTFSYPVETLKKIYSFCFWSMCEGIVYWMIIWVDTFFVSIYFSTYQLGLFKNPSNMVISIMSIISATIMSVVFTTLSSLRNKPDYFEDTYSLIAKLAAYIVFPMSAGMFLFRKTIVSILFGSSWLPSADVLGIIAIYYGLNIVFILINGETFKALGKPKILFISQVAQLIAILVFCFAGAQFGFHTFLVTRLLVVFVQILLTMFFVRKVHSRLNFRMIQSVLHPIVATFFLIIEIYLMKLVVVSNLGMDIILILISIIAYIGFIYIIFKKDFWELYNFFRKRA
ncbi:lipopolysaccharide biosynthesis protein [Streptococcus sp. A11]|uniref:Wzx n=1 Tax=Streptococcus suis TaxID=1307 RepID=A0A1C9IF15_STRSU|nr:Wzx [Streptococcus suis]AOP02943.1 Wzx [Streptococcus suis]